MMIVPHKVIFVLPRWFLRLALVDLVDLADSLILVIHPIPIEKSLFDVKHLEISNGPLQTRESMHQSTS